jgi:3-hydroxyacyl-CoA dehydrogenase
MGTHFFNPPRYLKVLELVPGPETGAETVATMKRFLEERVARRVVQAKDTPGFISNRYGVWCMFHAIHVAERLSLSVEQVDAITGAFLGRPNSATFRLNDLVGIDVMADIAVNLLERCPIDLQRERFLFPRSFSFLLEREWLGGKSGQGYYRKTFNDVVALDLSTLAYRERQKVEFESIEKLGKLPLGQRLREALNLRDEVGEYLRNYLVPALQYATQLLPEIAYCAEDFDRVMRWGFGWELGPFELIDAIGADNLGISAKPFYSVAGSMGSGGSYVPLSQESAYRDFVNFAVVDHREGFEIREMDGVAGITLTSPSGVLDTPTVKSLLKYLDEAKPQRLIIGPRGPDFGANLDLKYLLGCAQEGRFGDVDQALIAFQALCAKLRSMRSVAAVRGSCIGSGLELASSCAAMVIGAETQLGYSECRIGLFPAGSGTANLRLRHQDNTKGLVDSARRLCLGTISQNADDARAQGLARSGDVTIYHPDRLASEAIRVAKSVEPSPLPDWKPVSGPLLGMLDQMRMELRRKGDLTPHDELVAEKVKHVLARASSYEDALTKERTGFIELLNEGLTQARIKHMIETGKPLKN